MYFWFGAYLNYGTVVKKELLENTFKETIIFFFIGMLSHNLTHILKQKYKGMGLVLQIF